LRLELVANTPNTETMIAASMLTTTSGAHPGTLYDRLLNRPGKVKEVVGRAEVQHGNILEHNRLVWMLEATDGEVLEAALDTSFLTFTRLDEGLWLLSGNLRAIIEYSQRKKTPLTDALVASAKSVAPNLKFLEDEET
jgi:hypothetical protein